MSSSASIRASINHHLSSALFALEHPAPTYRGKVRDVFERGDHLWMLTTDRVSAFDQVLGTIPLKGTLLCKQAHWWFKEAEQICPTHLIDQPDPQVLVVKKATPFKIEIIVRGFLAGSLMREPKETRGALYGLKLDPNLAPYQALATPIVTPTTKADIGEHDVAISPQEIVASNLATQSQWDEIAQTALDLFSLGSTIAQERGLYLVDTKYEFGIIDNKIVLIDEIHTSDSSRFFLIDDYQQKIPRQQTPLMLDKEFLRQHILSTLGPDASQKLDDYVLTDEVRIELADRYFTLTEKIIGEDFIAPEEGATTRVAKLFV